MCSSDLATSLQPGVVARLKVISVASTSAVCELVETKRDLAKGDTLSLPDAEVKKIVDKDTVSNSRHYPMVISFTDGDPMDTMASTAPRARSAMSSGIDTSNSPARRVCSSFSAVIIFM